MSRGQSRKYSFWFHSPREGYWDILQQKAAFLLLNTWD